MAHTAADDLKFHLVDVDFWVSEANVHISANNAKYGTFDVQDAIITTNDIPFFRNFNLRDLFFRNSTPASNTVIHVVGIIMSEEEMKERGLL